ncbi:hypothetical protein L596_017829 [Steinernema carpocapsae]|uniref:Uncharacterized protein n=1 Tax=Steinernema carpocapsae TaxID=34508 RepID=A0A4U5N343_STECR|nr:hypothetical protein L596_017829 [Steinernema carpocapsae]
MPPSVPLMKIAKRKKGKMLKKKIKKKVGAKKPLVVAAKKVEEPVKEPEIVEDVEGEEVEEDDEVDEDESDHDEDMMNDNADGTVNMDFEAVPPSEEDREGLSNMLSQIFLKGEVSTNALIGGIIGQAPFGCVFVSTEEELDDEEDGVLYGVVTVLELGGKGKVYGKLLKFLVEKAKKHGDNNIVQRIERLGREAPEKKRIGVLINERMLNFPTQICGPSFSALIEDMKTGGKQFDFKEIVVISKIRLGNIPDADTVAGPRAQGQSKKKGKGKKKQLVAKALTQADVIFDNPEEELLFQG